MANFSMSDAELWSLIVKDDHHAFTMLFKRHWLSIYKSALRYIKDPEACEEVVHDLFLNIWKRRNYLTIINFERYLKASARYQVYSYLKKHRSFTLELREKFSDADGGFELNSGHEEIVYKDLEDQLSQHLRSLPERCQEIFYLSRKQQLNNSEIAERLGISKRTVENQITYALQRIRFNMKNIVVTVLLLLQIMVS